MQNRLGRLAIPMRGTLLVALSFAAASCAATKDRCGTLDPLKEGYQTVTLTLSWSGVTTDRPNFTKPGCDLPLSGVIISHDTMDMLAARIRNNELRPDRSSYESEVDAFLYVLSDKAFVMGLHFAEE